MDRRQQLSGQASTGMGTTATGPDESVRSSSPSAIDQTDGRPTTDNVESIRKLEAKIADVKEKLSRETMVHQREWRGSMMIICLKCRRC